MFNSSWNHEQVKGFNDRVNSVDQVLVRRSRNSADCEAPLWQHKWHHFQQSTARAGYSFDNRIQIFFSFARSDPVKGWEGNDRAGLHPGSNRVESGCTRYFAKGNMDWEIELGAKFLTRPQHFSQARLALLSINLNPIDCLIYVSQWSSVIRFHLIKCVA